MNIAKKVLVLTTAFSCIPLHSVYASIPVPGGQPLTFVQQRQIPQINSPEYYFMSQQNLLIPHQTQMQMITHTNPLNSSPLPPHKRSHQNKEQKASSKNKQEKKPKKSQKSQKAQ